MSRKNAANPPCRSAPGESHTLFVRLSCKSYAGLQATREKCQVILSVCSQYARKKSDKITLFSLKYFPIFKTPYILIRLLTCN